MNDRQIFPSLKTILKGKNWRLVQFFAVVILACACLAYFSTAIAPSPAIAQSVRPESVWEQVYQRLPDFPLENKYTNQETGEVDPKNTLALRFTRYHVYIKNRPAKFRLDWKLTLADYLGANEPIVDNKYPGHKTLQPNPVDGDRAAIRSLNRSQRNALVEVLVSIFSS